MAPQVAADPFIPTNAAVDCFVTYTQRAPFLEHAGNLLRAPFAAYQPRQLGHVSGAELGAAPTSPPACHGIVVGFLGAIVAVVVGRIAPQFAGDGAAVASQHARDLCR